MSDADARKLIAEIGQAAQSLRAGRRGDALIVYQDIAGRAGRHAGVQLQLGALCEELGDVDQAITHYVVAVEETPGNVENLATLGVAYLNAQELEKAHETLGQAAAIDPDRADVQHGLGVICLKRSDYENAAVHLQRACELKPRDAAARNNLAVTLVNLDRHDEALAHAEKAVKLDPSNPLATITKSEVLAQLGDMEAATKVAEQVVRKHPRFGGAYDHLARIRKFTDRDAPLIRKAEKALDHGMPPKDRWGLLYALGKMHDDCGHHDEAFAYYEQASRLKDRNDKPGWDPKQQQALAKVFSAKAVESMAKDGHASQQPVFVVGMPRSGTTLIERIIATHPDGAGAGELTAMLDIGYDLFPTADPRQGIRRVREEFTAAKMQELAEGYLAILRQGNGGAARIVDKMPGNAQFLGLIKVLFPNATIIHAIRNPLDTCLSCYFQNFSHVRWADNLATIGRTYANYRAAMDLWRAVLPEGSVLDVRYEDLVEDPESGARRMLEACGLGWDASVLDFHRNKGVVRTASVAQTRQPIYKTSRARWMNYAAHLGPLVAEIAPYLEDDRDALAEHGVDVPAGKGWLKRIFN